MTLNIEEKHAFAGGIVAAGIPTIASTSGLNGLIVDLADLLFEGNRGSAAFVSGFGFLALSLAAFGAVTFTDVDDLWGIIGAGIAAGFLALSLQSFAQAQ